MARRANAQRARGETSSRRSECCRHPLRNPITIAHTFLTPPGSMRFDQGTTIECPFLAVELGEAHGAVSAQPCV
jgi:hypothetical protein